jgi:hypothetical protein
MSDPGNLICGITIDITPLYPNASTKKRCRAQLWEGDEINSKLRILLERGGIESMTRLIKSQFTSPSYLRVRAEATGDGFTDDDEESEVFALEINVFGDATLFDQLSDIVGDIATAEAICADLRPLLVRYVADSLPDVTLKWELEPTEYGE